MSKLLEKTLKTGIKENKCVVGTKQVLGSLKNSKIVVISESVKENISNKIQSDAKKSKSAYSTIQRLLYSTWETLWTTI